MPGKRVARHARTRNRKRGLIGVAIVVVAVAVALVVAFGWLPGTGFGTTDDEAASPSSGSSTPRADTTASGSPQSSSSSPSPEEAAPTPARRSKQLRACEDSVHRAERAVAAADSGVGDWNSHVQARTDMLEGRMSGDKMDAVWARTRAAGPGDQERFKKALRGYPQPSKCEGLRGTTGAKRTVAARCVQRSRAATRALHSAEAAMKDWSEHLSNMARYADHEMSDAMAQERWVEAWRNAPKNISAYRTATATLAKAPPCPHPAS